MGDILITEKLDGSNLSIFKLNGNSILDKETIFLG